MSDPFIHDEPGSVPEELPPQAPPEELPPYRDPQPRKSPPEYLPPREEPGFTPAEPNLPKKTPPKSAI